MALNKRRGQMYEWIDATFNPIKGCTHACCYCYLKALEARYGYKTSPRFVQDELKKKLGNGHTIFLGSTGDMFGGWVRSENIEQVLDHCRTFDNTYVFQSKNPARFLEFVGRFPKRSILGTTIETNRYTERISEAPDILQRVQAMKRMGGTKFVSIEPILQFDLERLVKMIFEIQPLFVTIGADSKRHNLLEPDGKDIKELIKRLNKFTKVKIKPNLWRLLERTSG
jgi:DNA repair photolyase